MGPGLIKILNLIQSKPSETMLIDRFLVLAADLGEYERVEATLKLATSLVRTQPRRAIEVAWMIYKSGNKTRECLEIIVAALERLERFEKVAAIRGELQKTDSLLATEEAKNLAKITIEEHIANVMNGSADSEINRHNNIDTDNTHSKETSSFKLQSSPIVDFGQIEVSPANQFQRSEVASDPMPLSLDMMNKNTELDTRKQRNIFSSTQESPFLNDEERSAEVSSEPKKIDSIVRVATHEPNEGIPEAIPPKEPSQLSSKIMEDSVRLNSNKLKSKVANPEKPYQYENSSQPRSKKKLRELSDENSADDQSGLKQSESFLFASFVKALSNEDWDRLLAVVESYMRRYGGYKLLAYFENRKLYLIDLRFSSAWVDLLLCTRQERRALRFLIQKLTEEPQLAWAKMVWEKVPGITNALELAPIHWRESEGVGALRDKIARQNSRLGCYFIQA